MARKKAKKIQPSKRRIDPSKRRKIAKPDNRAALRRSESSGFSGFLMGVIAIASFGVVSPGASVAIFVCMLPTFVLLFGNKDGLQPLRAQCVGYLNAAGAFPFVYSIYSGDTTFLNELMNMKILLAAWGAALIGTFLQYIAPFLATSFLQLHADEKLAKIKTAREKLIEEWGPEVAGIQEKETSF